MLAIRIQGDHVALKVNVVRNWSLLSTQAASSRKPGVTMLAILIQGNHVALKVNAVRNWSRLSSLPALQS